MAVARPVRVLGLAAVMMWCFFLYQVFKPGSPIPLPSGIPKNEKEPLLDRESPRLAWPGLSVLAPTVGRVTITVSGRLTD